MFFVLKFFNLKEKLIFLSLIFLIFAIFFFLFYRIYLHQDYLIEGFKDYPLTFNPITAKNDAEQSIGKLLFRSLIKANGKGDYDFDLVEKITFNSSTKEYLLKIKDSYWSDGSLISSDDVIFTARMIKLDPENSYYPFLKNLEFEKIDSNSLKIKIKEGNFSEKNYLFPSLSFPILPQKVWVEINYYNWQTTKIDLFSIISGPYKIKKIIKAGQLIKEIEFEKNRNFFPEKLRFKKIVFKFFNDEKSLKEAFLSRKINTFLSYNFSLAEGINRIKISKIVLPTYFAIWSFDKNIIKFFKNYDFNFLEKSFPNLKTTNYFFDKDHLKFYSITNLPQEKEIKLVKISTTTNIYIPDNEILEKILENIKVKIFNDLKINIVKIDLNTFQEKVMTDEKFLKEKTFLYSEKYGVCPNFGFLEYHQEIINDKNLKEAIDSVKKDCQNKENFKKLSLVIWQRDLPFVPIFNLDMNYFSTFEFEDIFINSPFERFSIIIYN